MTPLANNLKSSEYMKKIGLLVGVLIALSLATVEAFNRPGPCEFAAVAEWVYLTPLIDDPYYVVDSSSNANDEQLGPRRGNDFSFQSGFRIGGMYGFGNYCDDIRVSWLHLVVNDRDITNGAHLRPTKGYASQLNASFEPGFAESKIDFAFNQIEGVVGHGFYDCGCWSFVFEGGLHFVDLEQKSFLFFCDTNAANRNVTFKTKGSYWGIGPQLGLDMQYALWDCLAFVGQADAALLVGESEVQNIAIDGIDGLGVDVKNEKICRMVPMLQARMGLNFNFCWCFDWALESGYQFITYRKGLSNIQWPSNRDRAFSFDIYTNIDFHGPYVSLCAIF